MGLRLEPRWGAVRVAAVQRGSVAAEAGIAVGDVVLSIDGVALDGTEADTGESLLEGSADSEVVLVTRHEGMERVHRLRRRSRP